MSTTFFKQTTAKALLVTGILVGTMTVRAVPAAAQGGTSRQFTLTPAQQAAYTVSTSLSPYARQLLAIAVMKLGPQRANVEFTELAQLNAAMPGFLALVGPRYITPGLQSLPQQYHQFFVDGLLGVTPNEAQFALQIVSRLVQVQQMQAGPRYNPQPYPAYPPSMGPGNSASDQPGVRDVWIWGRDVLGGEARTNIRGLNNQPSINMDPVP